LLTLSHVRFLYFNVTFLQTPLNIHFHLYLILFFTLLISSFSSYQLTIDETQLNTNLVIGCVVFLLKILQEIVFEHVELFVNFDRIFEETNYNFYFVVVVLHSLLHSIVMSSMSKDLSHWEKPKFTIWFLMFLLVEYNDKH
jgi:hypothetical protein